jgi:hypothetical protein
VLAFLDALCTALLQRNSAVVEQLMRHPLAGALPKAVQEEARRVMQGSAVGSWVPLNALKLFDQTAHLLGLSRESLELSPRAGPNNAAERKGTAQIELPLTVRVA